ncbi:helix-turn-helix transcriptional regulator [Streptomyces naganishii]|uniref:ArsR family transcriptional regulator n=1 Tax=Streptomyces naganishii JCM 4654 TaxID=1306179 RepID=A0A919CXL5_9ACTN|nr:helix-turn-helix domain-containing protein [Streptomyces naganishii]GHD93405.1 ArsR family transcriptional regulator [Streptomyces naganishii JCM 4654]
MNQSPPVGDAVIDSVSVLGEESRRRMFAYVRRAGRPVTRDEVAASVGISRKLAAFHLDKLVDAGLLRSHYEAPGGTRRVGRRPKVYEPTDAQITLSIPDRRHELLAGLLLDAVLTEEADENAAQAAVRVAGRHGRETGEAERARSRPGRLGPERGLTVCERVLDEQGYEPVRESPTRLRLRNCPFHPLAARAPGLVCGMNRAYLAGVLEGLRVTGIQAVLAPSPGECCVRFTPDGTEPDRPQGTEPPGPQATEPDRPEATEPDRPEPGES